MTPVTQDENRINYKAWADNMLAFIHEHGLEVAFTHWCGGWPYPGTAEPNAHRISSQVGLIEALEELLAADRPYTPDEIKSRLSQSVSHGERRRAAQEKARTTLANARGVKS